MKKDLGARLSTMRQTGEIKTGRQVAGNLEKQKTKGLFPGQENEVDTRFGHCYYRELRYPLDHLHGKSKLSGILGCSGPELALLSRDNTLEEFDPKKSVFIDVETTGLAGGTGTWAFLIGLGRLEADSFLLRQYFLRKPGEEKAILSHFNESISGFPAMISFNGKLFDLPLLQTRQMLAGTAVSEPRQHLDLLQCARVLWKKRLASRSLHSLEEALLGLQRRDDIPGAEIPEVYFNYLRRGNTDQLKKVFEHNVLDILSMVTLLERVHLTACGTTLEHPAETLALGCLCLEEGEVERGLGYLRETAGSSNAPLAEEASLELSLYYKKKGNWEEAVNIWQEALKNNPANLRAYIELAKYFEHRCHEYQTALDLTKKALAAARLNRDTHFNRIKDLRIEALQHRLNRLRRRLEG